MIKKKDIMCPIEFKDRSKAIIPITFGEVKDKEVSEKPFPEEDQHIERKGRGLCEKEDIMCPIEFTDRSKAIKPITFGEVKDREVSEKLQKTPTVKEMPSVEKIESKIIRGDDENKADLANYVIIPIKKNIYIDREGKEIREKEEIVCKICIDNASSSLFVILTKDIRRIAVVVGEMFSNAHLNYQVKKAEKKVENNFREATKGIPVIKYFTDYGWQTIDGNMVYAHDNILPSTDKVFRTGMQLPSYKYRKEQVGQVFFDAYSLYADKGPLSVMLSFSVLGVLYRVFEEAGYAPRFLLFINGKTGSMKTTLSKILYIQMTDEAHRDTPRRIDADTVVSFERGIVLGGRDTVTLIDDYAPAKTPRQKEKNEEKLESIIRMVGDRSTRSRSNTSLQDCRGEGVRGVVVLTGELMGKGLSSNLRCFYCGIKHECVNTDMITRFQNEPYRYTTLIQNFALFVSANWKEMVCYIKESFQQERAIVGKKISERRLIDSAVDLRISCEIVRKFLLDYCKRGIFEINSIIEEMKSEILMMACVSEAVALEESLAIRFAKIIEQLLQSGRLKMLNRRPLENDTALIDGFYDEDYYYFMPDKLYGEIKRVFSLGNTYLPLNIEEMVKAFYDEGIIVTSSNGVGKKTYYARILIGKRHKWNFLKIKKQFLQEIVER